jgi:hypothetical protein
VPTDSAAEALLIALGVAFVSALLNPTDKPLTRRSRFVFAILGTLLCLVGAFFKALTPAFGLGLSSSIRTIAADFRVWLGLLFLTWLAGTASAVRARQRNDRLEKIIEDSIDPILRTLERFVLPRRLTPKQITAIGDYLRQRPPYAVSFSVVKNDDEAMTFFGDIGEAIRAGDWVIGRTEWLLEKQPGLGIYFTESAESQARPADPLRPKPDQVLAEAFAQAQLRVHSSGGGTGPDGQLVVNIGPRHRGRNAEYQPWPP